MEKCEFKRRKTDGVDCPAAEDVADRAVKKAFAILGIDVDRPESVEEFRNDLRFGRMLRKAAGHGALTLVAAFFTGMAWLVYSGLQVLFGRH